ncbi:MAG TPA: carbohydrate ABC transporter permease [Candidatus Merdivicinus intestinavium]|nr:carbohydrate ABC transporter permease [Candidatus Merdivicinus intestinavium]
MKIKKTKGEQVFDVFNVILMAIVAAVMILPMLHVLSVSLSEGSESIKGGFFFYPHGFNLKGYETVFKDPLLIRSYGNTILYVIGNTVLTLFFTALTAYPLSIPGFRLKIPVTVFLTITMFISGGTIPTYMLMRNMGLINSVWVMMLPFCVGAYNVILFRTFFTGIPAALREAAIIDGASEVTVLFRIIFPLSKAIFATIGLFTLVAKWNDWFSALIYLNRETMYPLQMILRKILFNTDQAMKNLDPVTRQMFSGNEVTAQNVKMAAIIITTLPILCVYPFIQKYFVKGVFVGTIKG